MLLLLTGLCGNPASRTSLVFLYSADTCERLNEIWTGRMERRDLGSVAWLWFQAPLRRTASDVSLPDALLRSCCSLFIYVFIGSPSLILLFGSTQYRSGCRTAYHISSDHQEHLELNGNVRSPPESQRRSATRKKGIPMWD